MTLLESFQLIQTNSDLQFYLLLVTDISAILLGVQRFKGSVVRRQCFIGLPLKAIAISQPHKTQKRRLGSMVNNTLKIDLSLMIVSHADVDLPSEANRLLKELILLDTFINSLQTLASITYIPSAVPNLLKAIAASSMALALFSYSSEMLINLSMASSDRPRCSKLTAQRYSDSLCLGCSAKYC